jgi:23S rRNA (adenine2503-C2)-methyltransferase
MGEPLANYKRVVAAVRRITEPVLSGLGISQLSVTVSTVGLAPAIRKLEDEKMQVRLAVTTEAKVRAILRSVLARPLHSYGYFLSE